MSKSKGKKTGPKFDPRLLARPRLDALFDRHARGELDDDGLQAGVQALIAQTGHRPVLDALVKRMENTPEEERVTLMLLVERLRSPEVVDYLWQQVKRPGALSLEAKTTALVVLKEMGEEVDIADPGRYFSPRDFKPGDIESAEEMVRMGLRGMARHLRQVKDPAEAEAFMLRINRMPNDSPDGEGILHALVANAEAEANDLGADFLYAVARTTPSPDVQRAAEAALARLQAAGVRPVTPAILGLGQEKFYAAWMTDPLHPWQQSVNVAWERAPGVLMGLVFLLDFGLPWGGAIKDMFATMPMTPREYERQLVERAEQKMDERVYRTTLVRAQASIAAAVEANRKNKIPLPKEFNEMRHLVERWVLHPSVEALQSDATQDELGHLPLVPDRGQRPSIVDLRGSRLHDIVRLLNLQAAKGLDEAEADDEGGSGKRPRARKRRR